MRSTLNIRLYDDKLIWILHIPESAMAGVTMAGAENVPVTRDQHSSSQSDNLEFLQAPVQEQGI